MPLKLVTTVIVVLASLLAPPQAVYVFLALGALLLIAAGLSRIPTVYIIQRMAFLELVAGTLGLLSLFRPDGLQLFLFLLARSALCLLAILLFANTTPFSGFLKTLRAWHVPPLFISILALLYRYLFVLVDEMERMERARRSRTFAVTRSRTRAALITVIAQAFVRSAERAERIFAAMVARGWN